MSNTGGRPSHDYYNKGQFVRVKENGKYFSICKLCNTRLCTTAIERLKTHRVKCSTNSNDIDEKDFWERKSYSSIDGENESELLREYDVVAGECILIPETASTSGCKNRGLLDSIDTNLLPAKDVQPTFSAVVSKKPKKIKKIENFLDKVEKKDQLKIDESITEWLLSSNLPFNTVSNPFFLNFIKVLRPAYILPSTEVLNSILLNQVYDKWILTNSSEKNTGILLITRYPNCLNNKPSFISVIFHKTTNTNAKYTFIDIIDVNEMSSKNAQEKMRDFIYTSVEKANEKNRSLIFAVVSDFDCFYIEDKNVQLNFWYIKSNLTSINSLKKALTDTTFINKVKLLQKQFEGPEIQADLISRGGTTNVGLSDNDWDTNHNLIATCLSNYKFMRQIRSDENDYQFSEDVQLLFDNDFRAKLTQYLKFSIRIYELTKQLQNPESTIADMVEKWIQLYNKTEREEYKVIIDLEIKNFITPLFATANFLHPKYKGRALLDYDDKYMTYIREFVCDNITGEESLRVFTEYTENSRYFQKLIKITDNPILFWSNVANKQSMLQDFALNLLSIPPFTNQMLLSTSDCSISFDQEQSKKVNELYYTLKLNVL